MNIDSIDTSNIEIGRVYNSYAQFCEALNIKPSRGKGKESQKKDIGRFIEYEQIGSQKYKPLRVLDTIVKRKENSRNIGKHILPMKLLLLQILKNCNSELTISTTALAQQLSMIHKRYFDLTKSSSAIAGELGVEIQHIEEFVKSTTPAYKNAIKTILKQLSRSNAIMYTTTYVAFYEGDATREVSQYELTEITKIKRETMKKYANDMDTLFAMGKADEYYREVKLRLFNELEILNYYKAYKITAPENYLQEEYEALLEQIDVKEEEIIKLVQTEWNASSMKRFTNRHENAKKKLENYLQFGELKDEECFRISPDYLPSMQKISYNYLPQHSKLHT